MINLMTKSGITGADRSAQLRHRLAKLPGIEPVSPYAWQWVIGTSRADVQIDPGDNLRVSLAVPDVTIQSAEDVMAVYARRSTINWHIDGEVRDQVDEEQIRVHFLRPALASVFGSVVARYKTDTQRSIDVTAGQLMANVHFMDAVNAAKHRAGIREARNDGVPAVDYEDVVDCLLDSALSVAGQMEADPQMLIRHLQVKDPVTRVDAVPKQELEAHRYLRVHSA